MKVILSARARQDLQDIGDFIASDSPRRAQTFVLELRRSCLELAEHPFRFPKIEWFGHGEHRRRVHGNYLIIYQVEDGSIKVSRVISASVDISSLSEGD